MALIHHLVFKPVGVSNLTTPIAVQLFVLICSCILPCTPWTSIKIQQADPCLTCTDCSAHLPNPAQRIPFLWRPPCYHCYIWTPFIWIPIALCLYFCRTHQYLPYIKGACEYDSLPYKFPTCIIEGQYLWHEDHIINTYFFLVLIIWPH